MINETFVLRTKITEKQNPRLESENKFQLFEDFLKAIINWQITRLMLLILSQSIKKDINDIDTFVKTIDSMAIGINNAKVIPNGDFIEATCSPKLKLRVILGFGTFVSQDTTRFKKIFF